MNKRSLFFSVATGVFMMLVFCLSSNAFSQTMPAFQMKLTNGKTFSSSQLTNQKPVIIIYFAPDCEHCRLLMDELFKKISVFKNCQLIMATFQPVSEVLWFEKKYQTAKYANIKVGVEVPVFFFRNYYKLEHTPFTALFNKSRKLVASYKEKTPVDELIKKVKALN